MSLYIYWSLDYYYNIGFEIKQEDKCYGPEPCKNGYEGCLFFCVRIAYYLYGECTMKPDHQKHCCCVTK